MTSSYTVRMERTASAWTWQIRHLGRLVAEGVCGSRDEALAEARDFWDQLGAATWFDPDVRWVGGPNGRN